MIIQEDTRQQAHKHDQKHLWFESHGIEIVRAKMLVGDYCLPNKTDVVVDTKQDLQEVYSNLIQDHERFRTEADLALRAGIKLYVLVEQFGINSVDEVKKWKNPRYISWIKTHEAHKNGHKLWIKIPPKPPAKSETLMKIMKTMSDEHGVEWVFCDQRESGKRIVELLTGEEWKDG